MSAKLTTTPHLFKSLLLTTIVIAITACTKDDYTSGSKPDFKKTGTLTLSLRDMIVGQSKSVQVYFASDPSVTSIDDEVELYKMTPDGTQETVGVLYDDGNLEHFDEIKGDGVFSGIFTVSPTESGKYYYFVNPNNDYFNFRQLALSKNIAKDFISVYADIAMQDLVELQQIQDDCKIKYKEYLNGNTGNATFAIEQTANWLKNQPSVEKVESQSGSSILITYKSGLHGGFIASIRNAEGIVTTRGGNDSIPARPQVVRVPLSQQVRGENGTTAVDRNIDVNNIGNRNVMIFAPFEAVFAPYNERDDIIEILTESAKCGYYNIDSYVNQEATVEVLLSMTKYGTVVLATHGSQGMEFGTGEIVDFNATVWEDSYKAMVQAGKLSIWENVVIDATGNVEQEADVYAVRPGFIADLSGSFPNSIILNNSCESTQTMGLSNAFTGKGAQCYLGYSKVVNSDFAVEVAKDVFKTIAVDGDVTGKISSIGKLDPGSPFAKFELVKNDDLKFPTTLINGDFEDGLNGWSVSGDGRSITKLGNLSPGNGSRMGIISTGLGFTTAAGALFQSFKVPANATKMSMEWNFLSEEFLEYIGSIYQDEFQIVIRDENGAEKILYGRTIDGFAAEFGASESVSGQLIQVSPTIQFDQGDVYMTDKRAASFDISDYQGQCITLILRCNDVGDSIYDSAVLIDKVEMN